MNTFVLKKEEILLTPFFFQANTDNKKYLSIHPTFSNYIVSHHNS